MITGVNDLRPDTVFHAFFHSPEIRSHALSGVELWHSILVRLEEMHSIIWREREREREREESYCKNQ